MDHKLYFNRLTLNMYASYIFTEMTLFNLLINHIFYFFSRCKFSSFLEFPLLRIVKMSLRLCICSANDLSLNTFNFDKKKVPYAYYKQYIFAKAKFYHPNQASFLGITMLCLNSVKDCCSSIYFFL